MTLRIFTGAGVPSVQRFDGGRSGVGIIFRNNEVRLSSESKIIYEFALGIGARVAHLIAVAKRLDAAAVQNT